MKSVLILSKDPQPVKECLDVVDKCRLGGAVAVTVATIRDPSKDPLLFEAYDAVSYYNELATGQYGKNGVQTVLDAFYAEYCPKTPPTGAS